MNAFKWDIRTTQEEMMLLNIRTAGSRTQARPYLLVRIIPGPCNQDLRCVNEPWEVRVYEKFEFVKDGIL